MGILQSLIDSASKLDITKWGDLLSSVGTGLSAYEQGKTAKKLAKLQLNDYEDEKKRKKKTQGNIDAAYSARLPLTTK